MVKYGPNVSESENKEVWNNAYTLTLVPKWVQGYSWIKKGCESIEGELTEVSLYYKKLTNMIYPDNGNKGVGGIFGKLPLAEFFSKIPPLEILGQAAILFFKWEKKP